ncbi:MAG: dihydroorotate dehydrogenase, partial [Bacillota bacterium]|nr:dihydroorotate dehydrogenase [Bacillota bacterium]
MRDLTVNYAGLRLPTPLLVAAAGISERVELMKRAQDYGAGGIVMKSLFEEAVARRFPTPCFRVIQRRLGPLRSSTLYSFEQASSWDLERYCQEIARAKKELDIPVIASINCVTDEGWTSYAAAGRRAGVPGAEAGLAPLAAAPAGSLGPGG